MTTGRTERTWRAAPRKHTPASAVSTSPIARSKWKCAMAAQRRFPATAAARPGMDISAPRVAHCPSSIAASGACSGRCFGVADRCCRSRASRLCTRWRAAFRRSPPSTVRRRSLSTSALASFSPRRRPTGPTKRSAPRRCRRRACGRMPADCRAGLADQILTDRPRRDAGFRLGHRGSMSHIAGWIYAFVTAASGIGPHPSAG